ncbi:hypothetical protein [Clostridium peptidivorans]|uniref:hypothetical protein n=1 Tax=Clostridium peptidivorans TaxID=100174 RepID=UPI000BE2EDF2|nr:hypothetical protein [Clostridium peptidivorans]
MNICEKYLKENDELLFEICATGAINKVRVLFEVIWFFLVDGTLDSKDNYYILGIGKSNIYIIDLGKYYCYKQIPEDVKPRNVKVVEMKSEKSINMRPILFGLFQKIIIVKKNNTDVYYIGKKFINR